MYPGYPVFDTIGSGSWSKQLSIVHVHRYSACSSSLRGAFTEKSRPPSYKGYDAVLDMIFRQINP